MDGFLRNYAVIMPVKSYRIILARETPCAHRLFFVSAMATPSVRRISEEFQQLVATKKAALTAKPSIYEEKFAVITLSP